MHQDIIDNKTNQLAITRGKQLGLLPIKADQLGFHESGNQKRAGVAILQ